MNWLRMALCVGMVSLLALLRAAEPQPQDEFMGDYQGSRKGSGGEKPVVAQVFPLGDGMYQANILPEFDARVAPMAVMEGKVADGKLALTEKTAGEKKDAVWTGVLAGGVFSGKGPDGATATFSMNKKERLSPTLGAKPPQGAVVLLGPDTKDLNVEWKSIKGSDCPWELMPGGVMRVKDGHIISKKEFKNHRFHLEFKLPYEPTMRGQARGNSGVYIQARYEVQVLDSYGLEGKNNDCGGVYEIAPARVNMSAPPLQWQTYDVTVTAAEMDGDKVVKNARITVEHNGVKVHENLGLPRVTRAAPMRTIGATGGMYLQDHKHPVEYRNIWVVGLP